MKVVLNNCYGGFGLSDEAREMLGPQFWAIADWELDRTDPKLVEVVEKLGCRANGDHADLRIVDIPEAMKNYMDDYDGIETIHEEHRSW